MNRMIPTRWLRPAPLALELDRFFHDFWSPAATAGFAGGPALNVHELADAFEVEVELPGLALEDLDVSLEGRALTIRGERKTELAEGASWQRRERFHGAFSRTLEFGVDLDPARIEAALHRGVLTIRLAKAEQAKARRIPVSAKADATDKS